MKKNLTEMVFILDKSGSMPGLEADTIGGFNSMIERQKQAEGEALVSTVLFSKNSTVIHDRVDLRKIEPLADRQYFVGGGTALIDAIGGAIHHIALANTDSFKDALLNDAPVRIRPDRIAAGRRASSAPDSCPHSPARPSSTS